MAGKVRFIFNPMANLGRAQALNQRLQDHAKKLGGEWTETKERGHATTLAWEAAQDGYERVVAMGGDGTAHEVVNGLMKVPLDKRPLLGLVPIGSGNDYSSAAEVLVNPEAAIEQAISGAPRKIDVARMDSHDGHVEYWANSLGIGFDTIVTIRSRQIPFLQGFSLYLAAVLEAIARDYKPFHLKVTNDGKVWEEELLMFVMCNGKREGGGFYMSKDGRPDDGWLEYVGVRRVSRLGMLLTLPHFIDNTHDTLKHVFNGKFQRLEIISSRPLYIHADGEILAGFDSMIQHLTVDLMPGELQVIH